MSLGNEKDMLKKKCKKCKKGRYYEWHFLCDRGDYALRCGNCDHETQRWVEKKKKKKLTQPFKETVIERLLKDKKFKQHLEIEITDAILKENYYMANLMLKYLLEYKEKRDES